MRGIKGFTETEMKTLLQAAKRRAARGTIVDKVDNVLIVLAAGSGLRVGEIASLSLNRTDENRLDLEAGVLEIVEAKHGSVGIVPLDIMTLRVLRHYAREIRPRVRNADAVDRVFLSKTGKPYTPNTLTQKFRLMLARLGCPGHTAHDFRHFYVTDLLRRGVQPHVVQSLARHKDARTTLGIYAHASFEDLRSAVNRRVG